MKNLAFLLIFLAVPAYAYDTKDEQNARDMIQILDDYKNFDEVYQDDRGPVILQRLCEKSSQIREGEHEEVSN